MNDIEAFIRDAAQKRGIDPDIAVRVAKSEGSITEYARRGTFATGSSWWPFQLHYGGSGYEHLGNVAGMGNGFTKLTGWQPGALDAWRDATRYALNRAKASGWGAWYGAAHVGIGPWDGIDRNHPWDAAAERWDYEDGVSPVVVKFNPNEPNIAQNDSWSCAPTSTRWALKALGRNPSEQWIEDTMLAEGVVTREQGLMDASGAGLAAFIRRHYGEYGFDANNEPSVSFDWCAAEGNHAYPVLIGGRGWNHWAALKGFDGTNLSLMNPSPGWMGVGHTMSRASFGALGSFSAVRVWHPDLLAEPVPPQPPTDTRLARARALVVQAAEILAEQAP